MAVLLPPSVTIDIELPAYSILPSAKDKDVQSLIVAALSTFHFPQARQQFLDMINKSLSTYQYKSPVPTPNRSQRRKMEKKRG